MSLARAEPPARAAPVLSGILTLWAWIGAGPLAAPCGAQPPVQQATAPGLLERAIAAERRGEAGVAADLYLQLFEAEPDRPEWAVAAGRCLGLAGRYNDALDFLDECRKRFPDAVEIRSMLARTFLLKAEGMLREGVRDLNVSLYLQDAVDTAEEILAVAPGHRDARLILAQSLLQLGDETRALAEAEEATRRFPDHPGGWILVGRISLARFAAVRATIEQQRPAGQVQADLIQAAYDLRQRARQAFEHAIAADPGRPYPHLALGDLQLSIGNEVAAMAHYHDALVVDPRAPVDHQRLRRTVDAARRLAFYTAAAGAYRGRAGADPTAAAVLDWHIGAALLDNERWLQAQARFEQVLEQLPRDGSSRYYAMLCAYWADDVEAAARHAALHAEQAPAGFADLIRALPDADRDTVLAILEHLAQSSYDTELPAASREINRVLAYVTDTADHWNNYAFLCRETGRFEDSLEGYRSAMRGEPDSPQLLNDAGVILQYHLTTPENLVLARQYYERAIALAQKVLDDPAAAAEARQRAEKARDDARKNLAEMKSHAA